LPTEVVSLVEASFAFYRVFTPIKPTKAHYRATEECGVNQIFITKHVKPISRVFVVFKTGGHLMQNDSNSESSK